MYIVHKAYRDWTADILNLDTGKITHYSESKIIKLAETQAIYGVLVYDKELVALSSIKYIEFPTESELERYISRHPEYLREVDETRFIALYDEKKMYDVSYYVYYAEGDNEMFLGKNKKGITPYIQAAEVFDKETAYKTAGSLKKNSKTGKYWTVKVIRE